MSISQAQRSLSTAVYQSDPKTKTHKQLEGLLNTTDYKKKNLMWYQHTILQNTILGLHDLKLLQIKTHMQWLQH